jgi:ABC-type antimicrobial peptide transport system permease subunit
VVGADDRAGQAQSAGPALGAVALLMGGVGVANTMVISVLERRAEIGLHRSLDGRPRDAVVLCRRDLAPGAGVAQ